MNGHAKDVSGVFRGRGGGAKLQNGGEALLPRPGEERYHGDDAQEATRGLAAGRGRGLFSVDYSVSVSKQPQSSSVVTFSTNPYRGDAATHAYQTF